MELLIAYLIFELFTGFLAAETLALALKDGFGSYNKGRGKRQAQRDKKRIKTRRGRAWIALRGALGDFWSGFTLGGKDHGRKAWERRKGWFFAAGRWVRDRWEPIQARVRGGEDPSTEEGEGNEEGPQSEGPESSEECEHGVAKTTTCPKCKEAGVTAGPSTDKPAPEEKPPAKTPAPSPAGPTSATPTKGAVPVSDSTELTAPKVVDFWDSLADQAARQVEAEQAAGLDVPGGADVVDRLRSHAAAAHGEFDQMIEAAGSTGHATGEKYRAA